MIKRTQNVLLETPLDQSWTYLTNLIFEHNFSQHQLLDALEAFDFTTFVELSSKFLKSGHQTWTFVGNLKAQEAKSFALQGQKLLGIPIIPASIRYQKRVIQLQPNSNLTLMVKCKNENENNCSLVKYFQSRIYKEVSY